MRPLPRAGGTAIIRVMPTWLTDGDRALRAGALAALVLAGCDAGPLNSAGSKPETFDWAGEPIAFAPPPSGWRREGESSGGLKGVRFVKEGAVGEAIGVADFHTLARRLRRDEIRRIVDRFDGLDQRSFGNAVRMLYAQTADPFTPLEAQVAAGINDALLLAGAAFANDDRDEARAQLERALAEAERLTFTLPDVVAAVEFTPERRQEPIRWLVLDRRETTVGGVPAVVVDYTFDGPIGSRFGREAYFVHDSHLFVATFIGLKKTVPVFDRVLASVRFPP